MPGIFDLITSNVKGSQTISSSPTIGIAMPWNSFPATKPAVSSAFFPFLTPNPNLWDKLVDYRLVVIDTANGNAIVNGSDNESSIDINPLGNGTLAFSPMTSAWEFFFPITPQQLSITDAYSINTSATLRGILEEHSGVRFKNISIQGTFGVWPGRSSIVPAPTNVTGTLGILQSVFGGTIAAANNVATQFASIINNITSGSNASKPVTIRPDNTNPSETITNPDDPEYGGTGTGYFTTLMLTQFLEQYAEAKRDPKKASWRLVFDIPKQNQSFVVTPVGFTWNENANRPMEISYNLQMKAWRRIDLKGITEDIPLQVTPLSPGVLQQLLNTVSAAQNTAAAATNLIGSVRSDVDGILNIIRQTGILVKQIVGVGLAASDLPSQLVSDTQSTISQFLATVNPNNLLPPTLTDKASVAALKAIIAQNASYEGVAVANATNTPNASAALSAASIAATKAAQAQAIALATTSPSAIAAAAQAAALSAQLLAVYQSVAATVAAAAAASLNPSNAVFKNPLQYPLLLSQVPLSSLTLNSAQQNALQNELNTVNSFTVANLQTMRGTILTLCTQLSNSFGAGNAYYSALFNQPVPIATTEPMTLDEFDILEDFYALVQAYDILTATNQLDDEQILNSMEYVNALAATSGIAFSIPASKIQVPVPYGLNMEQIAMRYLGDPQLWIEIATLNELREPYIDENGFVLSLLSNADGRNIVIGSNTDLYIGQRIYLYSSTQTPTSRTIIDMVALSQTNFLLTLDGLSNLDVFTTADQAYIQAYLPGTVNSQNVIFVPSEIPAPPYDMINIPSSVANVNLVGLSKVDWLLDPYGDLAITNTGDFRLAAGIPNIIQALSIKLGTRLGTSLLNPDFGLGFRVGSMNSDLNAGDLYKQMANLITADPRFSGISGLQVSLNGPALNISLGVQVAGQSGVFPVGFTLPISAL